jgi:hypothetical protein
VETAILFRTLTGMRTFTFLALLAFSGLGLHAEEGTWRATISDSKCGAMHPSGEHNGKVLTDRQCALACIRGGAKYVAVIDGKVYNISNQDFTGLERSAGRTVTVTGNLSGDALTISRLPDESASQK